MRINRFCLLTALFISLFISAPAQDSHVRSNYLTRANITLVETDLMHLTDTPNQFVQVFLRGSYQGEKLIKPPDRIILTILSTSNDVVYEFEGLRNLTVITDGKKRGLGEVSRVVMRGDTENDKEIFLSQGAFIGFPIPVPPSEGIGIGASRKGLYIPIPVNAKVRGGKSVNGLITEYMQASLTLDQLIKMIDANKLELRLGKTSWEFSEEQKKTIREFTRMVKPN